MYKYLILLSLTLISVGVAIGAPLELSRYTPVPPAVATSIKKHVSPSPQPATLQGLPRHISVPSLGIDTSVQDGYYNAKTGQWTLSEDSAFFATPTDPANTTRGNTFIYGHNSTKIFGKLLHIQTGAQAIITTDNGARFTYTFISTKAVDPTDAAILDYSGSPRLTLQTCSGAWNQHRQMFFFNLTSYKKVTTSQHQA